jgi:nucleotide-binding universal stress UspA family protein
MTVAGETARVGLKNILYLTDFSESSEAALPFAIAIARNYGASVHALHVLTPSIPEACREAVIADEKLAITEMAKINSQLADVAHDTAVIHGTALWSAIEPVFRERKIDLIVLGTHGRTGVPKLLFGSFAEEIFRRSNAPVLTIGRDIFKSMDANERFHSVLFATDFSKASLAAAPLAVSIAEQNAAQLDLLKVMPEAGMKHYGEVAIEDVLQNLRDLIPSDVRMRYRPSVIVEYGEAADCILETAADRGTDLIVLGVRGAASHLTAATHLERATAHKVVAHARCPVLTVRG